MKYLKSVTAAIALVLSTNLNAAIVSADWQSTGDNLITMDTTSGLNWLDLTETNSWTYNNVFAQLGSGGRFEGFRYATNEEVIGLWANFNIDLTVGSAQRVVGSVDPGIQMAATTLGNILNEYTATYDFGLTGITSTVYTSGTHARMGAYHSTGGYNYYEIDGISYNTMRDAYDSNLGTGSYLVQTSVVPLPAAVWLVGSGLICLIGVAGRRKA